MKNESVKIEKEMTKRIISTKEFETIIDNDFIVYNSVRVAMDKILYSDSVGSTKVNVLKNSINLERYRNAMHECYYMNDSFYEYLKNIITDSIDVETVADNRDHNLLVFRTINGEHLFFNNEDFTLYPIGKFATDKLEIMDAIIDLFPFSHKVVKLSGYVSKPVRIEEGVIDVSYSISNKKGRKYWNKAA